MFSFTFGMRDLDEMVVFMVVCGKVMSDKVGVMYEFMFEFMFEVKFDDKNIFK